jgi:uncharacterized phage-associated protein
MVSANDIATYILERQGPMSAMKLQKLVYYAQAWHLVWADAPLFPERIEAWANGPVVPDLYRQHRGQFQVSEWKTGDSSRLDDQQGEAVDSVLNFYGPKDAFWLSELTHSEQPWIEARDGLAPGVRSSREISTAAMAEYYGSLV